MIDRLNENACTTSVAGAKSVWEAHINLSTNDNEMSNLCTVSFAACRSKILYYGAK